MSNQRQIIVILGTKAQYIKTAPILRELDSRGIPYWLVYTGQHSETFDILETAFGTRKPDLNLVPNNEADTHLSFLGWCLRFWWAVVRQLARRTWRGVDIGLVHGDTASTLFGAWAIRMMGARVAHVEAGLRSSRLLEPFPEEIIRRLVSRLTAIHFAPDQSSVENLRKMKGRIVDTGGNTLRDALNMALAQIGGLPKSGGQGGYAVVSMHRSENLSSRETFDMLMDEVIAAASQLPIKFVLHPATRARMVSTGWERRLQAVKGLDLMNRMDYPDFVRLLLGSRFLMTDGGSNQEEAAMLGLPTLLLRRATERSDGLGDSVTLSNLDPHAIRSFVGHAKDKEWLVRGACQESPSQRIVDALQRPLAWNDSR